jgi:hypothetical protein
MMNPDIDKLADSARRLTALQRQTTEAKSKENLEEIIRLRRALEAAQQHDIDGAEGQAIARQFNKQLDEQQRWPR